MLRPEREDLEGRVLAALVARLSRDQVEELVHGVLAIEGGRVVVRESSELRAQLVAAARRLAGDLRRRGTSR